MKWLIASQSCPRTPPIRPPPGLEAPSPAKSVPDRHSKAVQKENTRVYHSEAVQTEHTMDYHVKAVQTENVRNYLVAGPDPDKNYLAAPNMNYLAAGREPDKNYLVAGPDPDMSYLAAGLDPDRNYLATPVMNLLDHHSKAVKTENTLSYHNKEVQTENTMVYHSEAVQTENVRYHHSGAVQTENVLVYHSSAVQTEDVMVYQSESTTQAMEERTLDLVFDWLDCNFDHISLVSRGNVREGDVVYGMLQMVRKAILDWREAGVIEGEGDRIEGFGQPL